MLQLKMYLALENICILIYIIYIYICNIIYLFKQMLQLTDVFGQLENICIFLVSEQLLADGVVKLRRRAGKLEIQI